MLEGCFTFKSVVLSDKLGSSLVGYALGEEGEIENDQESGRGLNNKTQVESVQLGKT